jgi:hypothetical protein
MLSAVWQSSCFICVGGYEACTMPCIVVAAGARAAGVLGGVLTGIGIVLGALSGDEPKGAPLPKGYVGENPTRGKGGDRNSGPLTPENGGTGDPEKDFEQLTGGRYRAAGPLGGYRPGAMRGENGITLRPKSTRSSD